VASQGGKGSRDSNSESLLKSKQIRKMDKTTRMKLRKERIAKAK